MYFEFDKHHYFFEKFLRKEMYGEELEAFKEKLLEDETLKNEFDFYVSNRKSIIEKGLAEYDEPLILKKKPQKWGWLFLVVSILGLVLIGDYYITASYDQTIVESRRRKPLLERMNFFRSAETNMEQKEYEKVETEALPQQNRENREIDASGVLDTSLSVENTDIQYEKYTEGYNSAIQSDLLIGDSLAWVFNKHMLDEKLTELIIHTDSILDDSTIQVLAIKSMLRNPASVQKQLFIEFWESPIHFRGYRFSGKKLSLFGFEPIESLFFTFDDSSNTFHLFLMNKEYHLFADNQFHKIVLD